MSAFSHGVGGASGFLVSIAPYIYMSRFYPLDIRLFKAVSQREISCICEDWIKVRGSGVNSFGREARLTRRR